VGKNCPTCGAKVRRGFTFTAPPIVPAKRARLQLSERAEAALLIPAGQAIGTGAVIAAVGTLAADLWLPGWEAWKIGALCGVVAIGGVWWDGIRDDAKRVWYELERRFGVDLDRDGIVGEPEKRHPRQTAIDEIDERHSSGAPRTASLTWLPIAPEETQRLAAAVVVDGVRFVRGELVAEGAIKLNDYKGVKDALLDRRYLRTIGNGVGVTYAGYRWFCKKLPPELTPLPYTSLQIGPVKRR
jgi:hypothetical protein